MPFYTYIVLVTRDFAVARATALFLWSILVHQFGLVEVGSESTMYKEVEHCSCTICSLQGRLAPEPHVPSPSLSFPILLPLDVELN
jgi:hypothetical protein